MRDFDKKSVIRILIFLILAAFIVSLLVDLNMTGKLISSSVYTKYSIIVFCFIISFLIGAEGHSSIDKILIQCARLFTVLADYYLMILENYKIGILCFCIVQIIYILRHSLLERESYKNILFLGVCMVASYVIIYKVAIEGVDIVLMKTAIIYAALLASSLYCAISMLKRGSLDKTTAKLIALGMFLFFLCDVNVALFNIFAFLNLDKFASISGILIWIFYAPSQLILTLSAFKAEYRKQIFSKKG